MNDSLLVARVERVSQLRGNRDGHTERQRTGREPTGERFAFDQLQHEAADAVVLDKTVNGADVRVVERREKAASRSNRARRAASPDRSGQLFIATWRPRCGSCARETLPIPPAPSARTGSRQSWCPARGVGPYAAHRPRLLER